jgi:hypothetical protein
MTKSNAFWRLFPAALFTILGVVWCCVWRFDPVLIGITVCVAAVAVSWFTIAVVEVAKGLTVTASRSATDNAAASVPASEGA